MPTTSQQDSMTMYSVSPRHTLEESGQDITIELFRIIRIGVDGGDRASKVGRDYAFGKTMFTS